jgi:hypothetical protein
MGLIIREAGKRGNGQVGRVKITAISCQLTAFSYKPFIQVEVQK